MWVFGRLLPDGVRDGGVAIDVADDNNACETSAGGILFEFFDDLVDNHHVVTVADAETDRFSNPKLFTAEIDTVVGALTCCCGVVAQRVDEGEAVVYHFGGEDAAVHLCVSDAAAALENVFPKYIAVGLARCR